MMITQRTVYGLSGLPVPNDKTPNIVLIVEGVLIAHNVNEWLTFSNHRYLIVGVQTHIVQQRQTQIERMVLLELLGKA
jgi:hypothetical protein